MHMRNLSCFAESRIKCKEDFCQAEQSGKASTWGGPSSVLAKLLAIPNASVGSKK